MKKLISLMLVVLLLLSAAACGSPAATEKEKTIKEAADEAKTDAAEEATEAAKEAAEAKKDAGEKTDIDPSQVKVGLLIPGSPTDGGWAQTGVEALNAVQERTGCQTTVIEAATADVMKSEAENLADSGYNIIFGHGGQYASPFAEIADDYPDVVFATMGGNQVRPNLFPVQAKLEDCAYMAGVISALVTKTNKIGLLVGGDFPSYTKTTRGFELGARSINPDIEVMHAVLSTIDMNEAYETTTSQIKAGADVVWANANQATLGTIKAAKDNDVYVFGAQLVQTDEAPDNLIASLTQDHSYSYQAIFDRFISGDLNNAGVQEVGIDDLAVGFVWNEKVRATLPEEAQSVYEDYAPKLISDEIDVPGEDE
jgi:basic membrane protein A